MNEEFYNLYMRCFPNYPIDGGTLNSLLSDEKTHIIRKTDGGLVGFSAVNGNSISLLCVADEYRGRGIGGELLSLSEQYIAASGADKILLGRGGSYVFQGVPEDVGGAVSFFGNRGYKAGWSSVNMLLQLSGFRADNIEIPPCPADVSFRYLRRDETPELLEAVKDAAPEWLGIFADCGEPVLVAKSGGAIVGFEILSPDGGRFNLTSGKMGSIGCVGVVKSARKKGIGMRMVLQGVEILAEQGCDSIELLYVYLVDWYKKLGFEVVSRQWMGEKALHESIN